MDPWLDSTYQVRKWIISFHLFSSNLQRFYFTLCLTEVPFSPWLVSKLPLSNSILQRRKIRNIAVSDIDLIWWERTRGWKMKSTQHTALAILRCFVLYSRKLIINTASGFYDFPNVSIDTVSHGNIWFTVGLETHKIRRSATATTFDNKDLNSGFSRLALSLIWRHVHPAVKII